MRRRLTLFLASALGSSACSPASAGSDPLSTTDDLSSARGICTDQTRPEILADMVRQPLEPPRRIGGVALGGSWPGVSQATVERAICTGTLIPDASSTDDPYWWAGSGDHPVLTLFFDKQSRRLSSWKVNSGYVGTLTFRSRRGSRFGDHGYSIRLGAPIERDGQPVAIDWRDQAARVEIGTELSDGISATLAPELPAEETNCQSASRCTLALYPSGEGFLGFFDVRFFVRIPAAAAGGTAGSTPDEFTGHPGRPEISPPPPPDPG
jgi:hypothetical protein